MTPQEQLFSELFNHEKILVKDMDTLVLRAHREELSKIAFEARARLTAVDDEEHSRKKKSSDGKPSGFERSVNTDETTTAAINAVKERQKRIPKAEKIRLGLQKIMEDAGQTPEDAKKESERLMSAGTILARLSKKTDEEIKATETRGNSSESKPIFNPFEKK